MNRRTFLAAAAAVLPAALMCKASGPPGPPAPPTATAALGADDESCGEPDSWTATISGAILSAIHGPDPFATYTAVCSSDLSSYGPCTFTSVFPAVNP